MVVSTICTDVGWSDLCHFLYSVLNAWKLRFDSCFQYLLLRYVAPAVLQFMI